MCQLGHDHTVIAPGPCDDATPLDAITAPTWRRRERAGSARVVRVAGPVLPYDRTYHLLGRLDKIRSLVIAERPDVLEAHSPYLAAAAVVACGRSAARVRTAFWHADHVGTYVRPLLDALLDPLLGARAAPVVAERTAAWLWRSARVLLSPFDATFVAGLAQDRALRTAGVKNVVFAPFGVEARTFRPGARSGERRQELARDPACTVIVGVGRLAVEKRWDVVLDAFARVRARRPAVLALFGDGPERTRLERQAPPGVTFFGHESDRGRLASAMASADLLVHGCPCETFGLGMAEAVACGVPVVVPEEGGARESADPSCSETYRGGDGEACAAAVERLLARRGPDLEARAAEASSRVRTVDEHIEQVLSVYGDLLGAC